MGDEYLVIPVFLSGIVFQALLVSRSFAGAAGALSIAGSSLALAWYVTRDEADQILSLPFLAIGLFILVFGCFYRDQLLPRISAALLSHYTFLGVYALYVRMDGASVPVGVSVLSPSLPSWCSTSVCRHGLPGDSSRSSPTSGF